ncbi:conserved Plasmodium protein, unknown function [Plasmodium berghei]|uniref:Uncharacterized protein n=2 Tax=Plasmodium berghei TaxID=5821 RepID=A0A509AVY5_PLABA|nr:conserved Plasmodium protein, unknown function [Plasmodium berghei ANKA]CXJ28153.1 conserved Plasmodium protein, unknown function [Plasmodium berghei]SCM27039.1 conserved Plasmodium protein, unknown function [Plasmodium berghei]SCN28765.1 conserved Plasmodium protein, unknown function [Plasmodium berghei]SCO63038.1 conserved Plasmodium protein, unknown function [Plasmodium berghei]SCO64512.1 conserved Plasmodium protein, unknown function [Plasmodium berghei]|eukprot:XP_034424411.1 conserved Plasmodium protein, unknown function [Plasmodium berghei ANKA]
MKNRKNELLLSMFYQNNRKINTWKKYITTKINYKNINNFKIWEYDNSILKVDFFCSDNFKLYKDKELLQKTRISTFKNIHKSNITYLFLFIEFKKECADHFINQISPINSIHIQILTKLNYLFILKKFIKNDKVLNRYFMYLFWNNSDYSKEIINSNVETCNNILNFYQGKIKDGYQNNKNSNINDDNSLNKTYLNNPTNGYLDEDKLIFQSIQTLIDFPDYEYYLKHEIKQNENNSNIKRNLNILENYKLSNILENVNKKKTEKYKIIIYSNVNNKYIKHVYLNELENNINTQINCLYMFNNKLMNKNMLLSLYKFYIYFKEEVKQKNEFLFFLDRLCEHVLNSMNVVDIAFIFYTHIKLNYYNHLFLLILIKRLENILQKIENIKKGQNESNKELIEQYINKIKPSTKSIILFFHSLTNYCIYLNSDNTDVGHNRENITFINEFIYTTFYEYLQKNYFENKNSYKSLTTLDFIGLYSSLLKLNLKNNNQTLSFLKNILFDFSIYQSLRLVVNGYNTIDANEDSEKIKETQKDITSKNIFNLKRQNENTSLNIQEYAMFLNNVSKFFVKFNYTNNEYKKIIKCFTTIFETGFILIIKLFIDTKFFTHFIQEKIDNTKISFFDTIYFKSQNNYNTIDIKKKKKNFNEKLESISLNYSILIDLLKINKKIETANDSFIFNSDKNYDPNLRQQHIIEIPNKKIGPNYPPPYNINNVEKNIKYIVNILNSNYKILKHIISNYNINEYSKCFNKVLLYNFLNKLINNNKYINYYLPYINKLNNYINNTHLVYSNNKTNINNLFIANYIFSTYLSDFINLYLKKIKEELQINKISHDYICRLINNYNGFSQIVSNTLGAIQNLKILRYDIFSNVGFLIKKNIFPLEFIHIVNILHSYSSFKIRDEELVKYLLNKMYYKINLEKKKNINIIEDQILSNIIIALLKLDYFDERFSNIIFENYKNIKSIQSLINITFYICYYNLIDRFLKENHINYFFQQINIFDINNLTVENKTQLKLISYLILHVHNYIYCSQKKKTSIIPKIHTFSTISSNSNLLKKYTEEIKCKLLENKIKDSKDLTYFIYAVSKLYNYITVFKNVKNFLNCSSSNILHKYFRKYRNKKKKKCIYSFIKYNNILDNNLLYRKLIKKYQGVELFNKLENNSNCYINNTPFYDTHNNTNDVNRNLPKNKNENCILKIMDVNKYSIDMLKILNYKYIHKSNEYINMLYLKNYFDLHFIGTFPFSQTPINTTSNLHNEIYNIIVSLGIKRKIIKELPHYPYYVDIVII